MVLTAVGGNNPLGVWTSQDGSTWTVIAATGETAITSASLAFGSRLMLAAEACAGPSCETSTYTSGLPGSFMRVGPYRELHLPQVAFTAETYVLAGLAHDGGDPPSRVFISRDGVAWTEQQTDLPEGGCHVRDLLGGPSRLLFLGDGGCSGLWLSE